MTTVFKLGGSLLDGDPARMRALCERLARHAGNGPTVVVHGGGRSVSSLCRRLGIEPRFVSGLRVTDERTLEVVLMTLAGAVNKSIVAGLCAHGANAAGVAGGDGAMAVAVPLDRGEDLGHVGRVESVDPRLIHRLLSGGFLPVVASLALSHTGGWLNVNADQMAAALAKAMNARRLVFLTDVPGVLSEAGETLTDLGVSDAERMIASGVIDGGMRPKLEACREAIAGGVGEVLIATGDDPAALAGRAGTRLTA